MVGYGEGLTYKGQSRVVAIEDRSHAASVRRIASQEAGRVGFSRAKQEAVAIVATEIATNLVKHAGGGEIIVHEIRQGGSVGIELLSLDNGPAMQDVEECLRDGYSTSGSLGGGLGAVVRLASEVDIFSSAGAGTAVLARLWPADVPADHRQRPLTAGAVNVAKPREVFSGDGFLVMEGHPRSLIVASDGLGHGPTANEATIEALRIAEENAAHAPAEIIEAMHAALQATRGAAVAVAMLDSDREEVVFCGVGNISASIWRPGGARNMVSHNGTVGHEVRKIQEFTYPFPDGSLLVLHSDGVATRWSLDAYPGLLFRHPALVAGVLYRDFSRRRDDVTIVAARRQES